VNAGKLSAFRFAYGINDKVSIIGGHGGILDNSGEAVRLSRPDAPPADEPLFIPYVLVDEVDYLPTFPWPASPAGIGDALGRLGSSIYGNDPGNWAGQQPNPGSIPFGHALFTGGLHYVLEEFSTFDSLTIRDDARLELAGDADKAMQTAGLSITGGGVLDLADNDLIVHSTAATRSSDLASLVALIITGRSGGLWTGPGVTSSSAAADRAAITGLATLLNDDGSGQPLFSHFAGEPVTENDLLVKHTYNGDADLNGIVDADDYFRIDSGFALGASGYDSGDFDYNGVIDADDYFLIDSAFVQQDEPLFERKRPVQELGFALKPKKRASN
jgi:hypothetical protein